MFFLCPIFFSDVNNTPPVRTDTPDTLSASKVVDVPLRSDGKLRCDCQGIWRCRSDRGKRRKAHCVVHYGWCATKAQAHPFAVAVNFAINLPPLTIRFCTLNYSECAAGSRKDSNTLCCNNRRFCNEALSPKLAIISPHYTTASAEVPTTSIQQLPSLHTPEGKQ